MSRGDESTLHAAVDAPAPRSTPHVLPGAGREVGEERRLELLRAGAVIATDLSFTVSDPKRAGNPLVWANPAFHRLTGYGPDEALGHNCGFLQGPNTDRAAVARISAALRACHGITEVLLNYRKDGTAFWNQLSISPVTDGSGTVVNFVGVQSDVTERVLADQERQIALANAEEARRDLRLLTETTTRMTESLDAAGAARALAGSVVPAMADFCVVDLLLEPGATHAERVAAEHRDPSKADRLYELGHRIPPRIGGTDRVSRVLTSGEPLLDADLPEMLLPGSLDAPATDPAGADRLYRDLRPRSVLLVPLRARGRVLGVLTLYSEEPYGRRYTQRDLHLAADLALKGALAVDNARLYAREHAAAQTLQRSLLPVVPQVPGLRAASRYLVGSDGARVGGDWYDLLALPDGAVGLAVGDVDGHDLRAAAAMGQLRGVLRSYAWEGRRAGAVLDRCDQLVQGLEMAERATAVYARLEPGRRRLAYANAGHPPPLLRTPGGPPVFLDGNLSPLLGAVAGVARMESTVDCPAGSLLVLYTDGIIDAPGEDVAARSGRLRDIVAAAPAEVDVEALCDRIVDELAPLGARYDDIALLAVLIDG